MNLHEPLNLKGRLFIYGGRVTIDDFLNGAKPLRIIDNLIPTVGRVYILTESLSDINEVALGSNGAARNLSDTDLKTPLFSATPTDKRVVGTVRITELFIGVAEANFNIAEFGIKANGVLISTLVVNPVLEKTSAKTYTLIASMGWGVT